ncbi:MAG: pantetheine-phosphate adenylyltransferase [Crocinitomicaceae bacterium]|nr:pantetheine-phosphate adenylyltransferase [Crocinitomicaceae bacterium]|tara:strand:+ start:12898 stop:13356 length:459 start_codon:yes stop_codon:yes gene_type:complete
MKIAIFPGSFDPITVGHESIIRRALPLFDKIVIAIGVNSSKQYMFSLEDRIGGLIKCFENEPKIEIDHYTGLTVDYCRKKNASFILRGLRVAADFEFERNIALMNQAMHPDIESIFLISEPKYSAITSSVVRDIIRNNGDIKQFVPSSFKLK